MQIQRAKANRLYHCRIVHRVASRQTASQQNPKGWMQSICQRHLTSNNLLESLLEHMYFLGSLLSLVHIHEPGSDRQGGSVSARLPATSIFEEGLRNKFGWAPGRAAHKHTRTRKSSKGTRSLFPCITCCRPRWWRRGMGAAHDLFIKNRGLISQVPTVPACLFAASAWRPAPDKKPTSELRRNTSSSLESSSFSCASDFPKDVPKTPFFSPRCLPCNFDGLPLGVHQHMYKFARGRIISYAAQTVLNKETLQQSVPIRPLCCSLLLVTFRNCRTHGLRLRTRCGSSIATPVELSEGVPSASSPASSRTSPPPSGTSCQGTCRARADIFN